MNSYCHSYFDGFFFDDRENEFFNGFFPYNSDNFTAASDQFDSGYNENNEFFKELKGILNKPVRCEEIKYKAEAKRNIWSNSNENMNNSLNSNVSDMNSSTDERNYEMFRNERHWKSNNPFERKRPFVKRDVSIDSNSTNVRECCSYAKLLTEHKHNSKSTDCHFKSECQRFKIDIKELLYFSYQYNNLDVKNYSQHNDLFGTEHLSTLSENVFSSDILDFSKPVGSKMILKKIHCENINSYNKMKNDTKLTSKTNPNSHLNKTKVLALENIPIVYSSSHKTSSSLLQITNTTEDKENGQCLKLKRAMHNVLEKKRRLAMKSNFVNLLDCIPELQNLTKVGKLVIIKKAIDFLRVQNEKLKYLKELKEQNAKLKEKLIMLQKKKHDLLE